MGNLELSQSLLQVNARVLPTPTLKYDREVSPQSAEWNLRNEKFHTPKNLESYGLACFALPRPDWAHNVTGGFEVSRWPFINLQVAVLTKITMPRIRGFPFHHIGTCLYTPNHIGRSNLASGPCLPVGWGKIRTDHLSLYVESHSYGAGLYVWAHSGFEQSGDGHTRS